MAKAIKSAILSVTKRGAITDISTHPGAAVWLKGQDEETVNDFINEVKDMPQVMECHLMAGDCDFLLRIAVADLDSYRQFQIEYLTRIRGVQSVKTEIPMQNIKLTSKITL